MEKNYTEIEKGMNVKKKSRNERKKTLRQKRQQRKRHMPQQKQAFKEETYIKNQKDAEPIETGNVCRRGL